MMKEQLLKVHNFLKTNKFNGYEVLAIVIAFLIV